MIEEVERKPEAGAAKRNFGNLLAVAVSLVSLATAVLSLLISYNSYGHSQAEQISLSVFPRSDNNSAYMVEVPSEPGTAYLFVFWDCLFTNIGDRPVTIVHYDIREQLENGSFDQASLPVSFVDESDKEIKLPLSLDPAESKLIRVEVPLRLAPAAFRELDELQSSGADFSLTDVVFMLFLAEMDIYGNKLKIVVRPNSTTFFPDSSLPKQQRFKFSFATGRGAKFETISSLYGSNAPRILGR